MNEVLPQDLGQFHAKATAGRARRPPALATAARRDMDPAMPNALDLLTTRRSLKPQELVGPPPTDAEIDSLLAIASRVPDHGKLAPWRFIVFAGDGRARAGAALAEVFRGKNPDATPDKVAAEAERFSRAPLVIAVVSRAAPHAKIPEWEQVLSAGAAAMNLVIAAYALGFAATWLTEWCAYDEAARAALGLAPHERVAGFLYIGRPSRRPDDRPRPPLADIVTRF